MDPRQTELAIDKNMPRLRAIGFAFVASVAVYVGVGWLLVAGFGFEGVAAWHEPTQLGDDHARWARRSDWKIGVLHETGAARVLVPEATLRAGLVLDMVRTAEGHAMEPGWQGFISDTIMRELGIQLVDGRMPGFAAILGPAPTIEKGALVDVMS